MMLSAVPFAPACISSGASPDGIPHPPEDVAGESGYSDLMESLRGIGAKTEGLSSLFDSEGMRALASDYARIVEGEVLAGMLSDLNSILTESGREPQGLVPETIAFDGGAAIPGGETVRLTGGGCASLGGGDLVFGEGSVLSIEGDFSVHGEEGSAIVMEPGSTLRFFGKDVVLRDTLSISIDGDLQFSLRSERAISRMYTSVSNGFIDISEGGIVEVSNPIADSLGLGGRFVGASDREAVFSLDVRFDSSTSVPLIFKEMDRFVDNLRNKNNSVDITLDVNVPRIGSDGRTWMLDASAGIHYKGNGSNRQDDVLGAGLDIALSDGGDVISAGIGLSAGPEAAESIFRALYTGVLETPRLSGSLRFSADADDVSIGGNAVLDRLAADVIVSIETAPGDDGTRLRISTEGNADCTQDLHIAFSDQPPGGKRAYSFDFETQKLEVECASTEFFFDPLGTVLEKSSDGTSFAMRLSSPDGVAEARFAVADGSSTLSVNGGASIESYSFSMPGYGTIGSSFRIETGDEGATIAFSPSGPDIQGRIAIGMNASILGSGGSRFEIEEFNIVMEEDGDGISAKMTNPFRIEMEDARIGARYVEDLVLTVSSGDPSASTGRSADDRMVATLDADIEGLFADTRLMIRGMSADLPFPGGRGASSPLAAPGAGTMVEADRIDMGVSADGFSASLESNGFHFSISDEGVGTIRGGFAATASNIRSGPLTIESADILADMEDGIQWVVSDAGMLISGSADAVWNLDLRLEDGGSAYGLAMDGIQTSIELDGTVSDGMIGALADGSVSRGEAVRFDAEFSDGGIVGITVSNPSITMRSGGLCTEISGSLDVVAEHVMLGGRAYDEVVASSEEVVIEMTSDKSLSIVSASAPSMSVDMGLLATGKHIRMQLDDIGISDSVSPDGRSTCVEADASFEMRNASPYLEGAGIDGCFDALEGRARIVIEAADGITRATADASDASFILSADPFDIEAAGLNGSIASSNGTDGASCSFDLVASALSIDDRDSGRTISMEAVASIWNSATGELSIETDSMRASGFFENGRYSSEASSVSFMSSSTHRLSSPGPAVMTADSFSMDGIVRNGSPPSIDASNFAIGIDRHGAIADCVLINGEFDFRNCDLEDVSLIVEKDAVCRFSGTTSSKVLIREGAEATGTVSMKPCSGTGLMEIGAFGIDLECNRSDVIVSASLFDGSVTVSASKGYALLENESYTLRGDGTGLLKTSDGKVDASTEQLEFSFSMGDGLATVQHYNDALELPVPVREGYNFIGWHDDDALWNGEYVMPLRDVRLKQMWSRSIGWEEIAVDDGGLRCGSDSESINLSSDAMKKIGEEMDGADRLTLSTGNGGIAVDRDFISGIDGEFTVTMYQRDGGLMGIDGLKESSVLTEFGLSDSSGDIHEFNGKARIYIPIPSDWDSSSIEIWHIDEFGTRTEKVDARVEIIDGKTYAVADVEHFSSYLAEYDYDGSMNDLFCIALLIVGGIVILVEIVAARRMRS